jgi:hypothetical protein
MSTVRRCTLLFILAFTALALPCCGAGFSAAQQELGRKHCSSNADCASNFCRDGLCG